MHRILVMNQDLMSYRKKITSQWGEDGVIEEIFRRIGVKDKFCVEIGAWNGKYLSNTWHLWHNEGWHALLIESDTERGKEAEENAKSYKNVQVYSRPVTISGENSFDQVMDRFAAGRRVDLVSIDIDGDDYYIFQSIRKYLPRVVIIEYNPTIPPEFDIVQKENEYFGASALALLNLAKKKGYDLAAITESNCIFVLQPEFEKLHIQHYTLEEIFPRRHLAYIITSFAGTPFINQIPPFAKSNLPIPKRLPAFTSNHPLIPILPIRKNESLLSTLLFASKRLLKRFKVDVFFKKLMVTQKTLQ